MKFQKRPWGHDVRSQQFTTTALKFGAIEQIVPTLNRPRFAPYQQGNTLWCAIESAIGNGRYIHGQNFNLEWQKNKVSRLQGKNVDTYGSDPNAAMDSQTYSKQGGYLPDEEWDPIKAEILDKEAINYSNEAYIKPASGKDIFDSICMELQRHYNFDTKKGACVQMFTGWYDSFNGGDITAIGNLLGYHSYLAIDFDRTDTDESRHYLVLQNSYGENIGDKGFHRMYRPVVNELLKKWGTSCKIPSPLTPEQIALAKQSTPLGDIQRNIINLWYAVCVYLVGLYGRT